MEHKLSTEYLKKILRTKQEIQEIRISFVDKEYTISIITEH